MGGCWGSDLKVSGSRDRPRPKGRAGLPRWLAHSLLKWATFEKPALAISEVRLLPRPPQPCKDGQSTEQELPKAAIG